MFLASFCPAFPDGRSTFADPSSTSTAPVLQSSLSGLPIFSHRPHSTTVFKILLTRMSYWTRAQQASFYLCENLSSKPQAEDLGPGLEGVSGKRLTDTSVTCQGPINCQRFVGIPTQHGFPDQMTIPRMTDSASYKVPRNKQLQ